MSDLPTPKYSIGTTVFVPSARSISEPRECPDCLDSKNWLVKTPAGDEFKTECQTCHRYMANSAHRYFVKFVPEVRKLTIGSIRIDTNDADKPVSYMCRETGVGSGSVYDEKRLYSCEEEAMASATAMAEDRTEQENDRNQRSKQDRKINRMMIIDARVADAERKLREGTAELRHWGYFLDDMHLESVQDARGVYLDEDTLTRVSEHIREQFKEYKEKQTRPDVPV